MVPVPKMSPSGWNCAQVRAVGERRWACGQSHQDRKRSKRWAACSPPCPAAGTGGNRFTRINEQIEHSNTWPTANEEKAQCLWDDSQQPEVSSVTLVSTRPVWMSEKAQYWKDGDRAVRAGALQEGGAGFGRARQSQVLSAERRWPPWGSGGKMLPPPRMLRLGD